MDQLVVEDQQDPVVQKEREDLLVMLEQKDQTVDQDHLAPEVRLAHRETKARLVT